MTQTIVYTLICINVVTFLVYGIDKWKAKKGSWSILLLIPRLRNGWSYIRRSMATEIIGYVLKRCSSRP